VFDNQVSRQYSRLFALILCFGLAFGPRAAEAAIGSWVVVDAKTGRVLDEKDANRKWYPASLTKIMTAYVTYKAIREGKATLNSVVVQSKNSLSEPPSKMGFKVGTKLTVEAALKIILIKSANDVAVALGEAIAGSEPAFIAMMNAEAARLGMQDTRFVNPHGLPDNRQVSSAQDMAILAMAFRKDFPEARSIYKHPGIQFGKKKLRSANREFLLRVKGADGMKTGYICNSGYNVAASATRGGRTVIAIVLGAASGLERIAHTRELIDKGFRTRRGGVTVEKLARGGAKPPADRYCKRNAKPGATGIMTRYDMQKPGRQRSAPLAYAPRRDEGGVVMPGKTQKPVKASTGIKLANGKIDWNKVMDRTIGPRRLAYKPIPVRTGVPANARAPEAGNLPIVNEDIPLPRVKPGVVVASVVENPGTGGAIGASTEPVASASDSGSPGSLFKENKWFGVPIPRPSPLR